MNRSVSRRIGWRIAVAIAAVAALLLSPLLVRPAAADDLPFSSVPGVNIERAVIGEDAYGTTSDNGWVPNPSSYSYQWYFNDVPIDGATNSEYPVPVADAGGNLRLDLTANLAGYAPSTVSSAETLVLGVLTAGTPSFSPGFLEVGQPITVDPGDWLPAETTFTYNWFNVHGAVGDGTDTYTPKNSDQGGMWVTIAGYATGYASSSVTVETGPIAPDAFVPATPTIIGSPYEWSTLQAANGDWNPQPTTFSYQWDRDGVAIPKATSEYYLLEAADVTHSISVTVTGEHDNYASVSQTSGPLAITKGPRNLERATITGVPGIGHELVAHLAQSPNLSDFYYIWYLNGVPAADSDPNSDAYFPSTPSDVGQRVTVAIRAISGSPLPQDAEQSAPTAPIANGKLEPGFFFEPYAAVGTFVSGLYYGPVNMMTSTAWNWVYRVDGVTVSTDGAFNPTPAEWRHKLIESLTMKTPSGSVTTTSPPMTIQTGSFDGTPTIVGVPSVKKVLSINESQLNVIPSIATVYWYEVYGHSSKEIGTGSSIFVQPTLSGERVFAIVHASNRGMYSADLETPEVTIGAGTDAPLLPERL